MKLRSYAKITIRVGALSLLVLVPLVARSAPRTQIMFPEPAAMEARGALASTDGFSMRARVGGLFPGARRSLHLRIRNPNGFPIKVTKVTVHIRRDLRRPRCRPRRYLRATRLRDPVRVPAKSIRRTRTRVAIRMKASAPDACQRAVFALRLKGRAVRP
jgi:hypothetical protein